MSRLPSFRGVNLDLSGPLGQRAESGRVAGQLFSAKTPQEAQALLGGAYQAADTSALAFNQALFNATQAGYQQLLADQTSAQDAIAGGYADLAGRVRQRNDQIGAGYGQLSSDVLADIEGLGATRARDIGDSYERSLANQRQRMISSGLGNSTVLGSIDRGLASDRDRQLTANNEAIAGLRADYRSRLGQAGLNFRERGLGMEAGLGQAGLSFDERAAGNNAGVLGQQLNWMNTIQAPYPDAGLYAALAQQYGAAGQADADRNLMMSLAQQDRQFAQGQLQKADEPVFETPSFGGGLARGVGGFSAPLGASVGQSVLTGAGGPVGVGGGAFFGGPSGGSVGPGLVGAGGGFAGAAGIAPGYDMEAAGAYTGYGGQSVAGSGFGGGTASTGNAAAGTSGGGGSYSGYGGGTFASPYAQAAGGLGDYLGGMFGY